MTCCDNLITKEYVMCLLKCLVSNIELFHVCVYVCVCLCVCVCVPAFIQFC